MSPFKDQLTDTDEVLIARYRESGHSFFFGELYKRYTHLVFGLCMKHFRDEEESKDMVMNIFEKLMHKLQTEDVKHFKSWLYIVAKNECLMQLRRNKKLETNPLFEEKTGDLMESGDVMHLNEETGKEEILQMMEAGIKMLSEGQKICIELFYLQQKSYQEVSDMTGYTVNEVKSHIQNGKRNLKIQLSRENE